MTAPRTDRFFIPANCGAALLLAGTMTEQNVFLSRFGDEGTRPTWIYTPRR